MDEFLRLTAIFVILCSFFIPGQNSEPRAEERTVDIGENRPADDETMSPAITKRVMEEKGGELSERAGDENLGEDEISYLDAFQLFQDREYGEALSCFQSFPEKYPESKFVERVRFLIGDCYFQMESGSDYQSAVNAYQSAMIEYPKSGLAAYGWFQIGESYRKMGLYYEAGGNYQTVIDKFSDSGYLPKARMGRAESIFRQRKYQDAITGVQELLKDYPNSDELAKEGNFIIANSFCGLNKYSQAGEYFEKALSEDPYYPTTHPLTLKNLGTTFFKAGDYSRARKYLFKAINLFPRENFGDKLLLIIADSYCEEGMIKIGLKMYRETTIIFPGSRGDLVSRLKIADFKSRKEGIDLEKFIFGPGVKPGLKFDSCLKLKPIETYQRIVEEYPSSPQTEVALLRIGVINKKNGNFLESVNSFRKLFQNYPNSPRFNYALSHFQVAYSGLIDFYFTRNEFIPLIESYEEDRDLYLKDYEDEKVFLMIGEAYEKLGLFEEALKIYQGITKGKEMKGEALFKMGKIHQLLGDYPAAGELLSRFTVNFKDSQLLAAAELTLATIFYRSGKFSKAIPLYFSSYTSKPELGDPWGYFCLGNALKKLGRLSSAVDAYRKSVEIRMEKEESTDTPDFITQCHFLIADCFFSDRKYQDALAAYLSVLKKHPGDKRVPWAWYRICVCYKALEMTKETDEAFDQLAKTSSDQLWREVASVGKAELMWKKNYEKRLTN